MLRRIVWVIAVTMLLLAAPGCGSLEVEYPENPTPPPNADPGVSSASPADQDG